MEKEKEHEKWFWPVEQLSKGQELSYVVLPIYEIAIQERETGVG